MQHLSVWFSWLAIISGFIGAALWFWATWKKVDSNTQEPDDDDWSPAQITTSDRQRQIDVLATAEMQTKINSWAAAVTGLSILCQALSLLLAQG